MLLKSVYQRLKISGSALKNISLPIGMILLISNGSATAGNISSQLLSIDWIDTATETQERSLLMLSQNKKQPPEIIVETKSSDSTSATTTTSTTNSTTIPNRDTRFGCQYLNGDYTVTYHPKSQPGQVYPWAVPSKLGGGWTQRERCLEISRRLESYRPDGLLELRIDLLNNYEILCVTTQSNPTCRIVLTVPPDQNGEEVRDRVFENLILANKGEQTQAINTYTDNQQNTQLFDQLGQILNFRLSSQTTSSQPKHLDLRPFLDRFDGGTGAQLN